MIPAHDALTREAPAASYGEGFKITLACPRCGTQAWVEWKRLTHRLRCPKCRCQFLIGPRGKLLAQEELPQTHYRCPRCRRSGSVPTMLAVRRAECLDCKLPLVPGPDQRLHDEPEAAALHRRAAAELKVAKKQHSRLADRLAAAQVRLGKLGFACVACGAAAALVFGVAWIGGSLRPAPDRDVRCFTLHLLAGDWQSAKDYLPDDDVERAEFERWRVRHFTSIIEKFRPAGDRPSVEVVALSETPDQRSLEIAMSSPFLGTRKHRQEWQRTENGWRFSALKTLGLP